MSIRRNAITRNIEARKSSLPTIGKGKPLNSQGNEGDLTFRRTSNALMLYIKANHSWHGVKVGESFSSLEKVINDVKSKVDTMKQFKLPSTYSVTGDFTLDVSGDINLEAGDNETVTIDANCTLTSSGTNSGLVIDYDHTGIAASGQSVTNKAIDFTVNSDTVTHVGAVNNYGIYGVVDGATSGIQNNYGIFIYSHSADNNYGLYTKCTNTSGIDIKMVSSADVGDYCTIATGAHGATTITTVDDDAAAAHLTLDPDGDLIVSSSDVKIDTNNGLYLDGGGDTYIYEAAADLVRFVVGGDIVMTMMEQGDDGNQVYFQEASVGFQQKEPTYDATNTIVDFRHSNKQNVTFGAGNITNLLLYFPNMSGNFQVLIKQDGTGSRTITNYRVYEADETIADGEAGVKWAGGSAPTLTTDANHVDILSFYWDNDNEICYGVATLDFQF